jgi:eukaryotic-like serine/threonine-protein kinase
MGREVLPPGRAEPGPDELVAGRYRLDRSLGNGGMGEVFVATDTTLGRRVALKRLSAAVVDDETAKARFFREARALARINSPNVVAVFDAAGNGDPYLVMELIDGTTLREELRRTRRLPPERAAAIGAGVAAGLAAAHAQGVIHRDVKPSNIFLTAGGEPKVGDFGIARLERGDQTLTMTGQTFGSVAYMAPEQATGSRVDARADLYSLGCVLYEMLAGRRPFDGREGVALTYQHVHLEPVRVDALDGRISLELASLVDSLLEKDPADRPATADEVRDALTSVPATATAPAPPPDEPERTAVLPSRAAALRTKTERPWWLFAALAGAILLSLFALANAITNDAPTHPRRSAQQTTSRAPTSPPATSISPLPSTPQQAGAALVALAQQIAATDPPAKHVADDVEHTVQDVLERLDESSEAIDKLNELKSKIAEEADKGHISSTDVTRLDDAIDRLARTVSSGGEGD